MTIFELHLTRLSNNFVISRLIVTRLKLNKISKLSLSNSLVHTIVCKSRNLWLFDIGVSSDLLCKMNNYRYTSVIQSAKFLFSEEYFFCFTNWICSQSRCECDLLRKVSLIKSKLYFSSYIHQEGFVIMMSLTKRKHSLLIRDYDFKSLQTFYFLFG